MAQISWLLCCEEFVVKENGLCDARDILFELHTPTVPVLGKVGIDVAALWRTTNWESEEQLIIRMALVFQDGTMQPSNETWQINFTSPQVLWYKRITDLYLQDFGFTTIAIQVEEAGDWVTKAEYPIMVIQSAS
jgi:hypothetical protein